MRPDWLRLSTVAFILALHWPDTAAAATLDLQTFKTHSRLMIDLDPSIEPKWTESKTGFELTLPSLDLIDVQMSEEALARLKDVRLRNVSISSTASGVVIRGEWNFPAGDAAPADPKMERFQYREKSPARYLVDFWVKEGPTVAELRGLRAGKDREAAVKNADLAARKRQQKRQELEKQLRLQEDVGRFCQEPLKDGVDIFLPFHSFHDRPAIDAWLPEGFPDEGFQYLKPKAETPDSKYVKLAHELYETEKFALTIRTIEMFEREQPASRYQVEMRFLKANALLKLGQAKLAHELLQELKDRHLGHPVALHAAIHFVNQKRREENHLGAVEDSLWLAQNYPAHRLTWVFHLIAAESLYSLKQTDRAVQAYEWVIEKAPTREARAVAALRVGDAYLARFQYDRALAAYFKAGEKFGPESAASASLQINRAESLYWLGQYDRALAAYESFVKSFSGHPAGWRAYIRMGEIHGRRSGPAAIAKSREQFLHTINHYPFSPGATLARLRLISCGDHGGFTGKTAKQFFQEEAMKYDGAGEVVTERYSDLRAMTRIRGMILLGDTTEAMDALLDEKEGLSRKSAVGRWVSDMEKQLFRKSILTLLERNRGFEAVQFYDRRIARVNLVDDDESSDRAVVDPDYLLRLSRTASDLGLGKLAQKISKEYEKANSAFIVARGIASARETSLDERLRASERVFTAGKALWVAQGAVAAGEIREKLKEVIDESPFSFQREIILGQLDSAEGKGTGALRHAMAARLLLAKAGTGGEYTRDHAAVDQWIVKLQIQAGQTQSALASLRSLQAARISNDRFLSAQLKLPSLESREEWILTEAVLLEKSGRWGEAAAAYEKLVSEGRGGNRALVQMALALEKTGRADSIARSNRILKQVSESPSTDSGEDFWKELARKAIAGRSENAKEGN